jgi:methyl-accepting chemotaxis protein
MRERFNAARDCPDLSHYEMVAKIMADELSTMELAAEPLDVAETIETLGEEMGNMPGIISDCRQAVEAFDELDSTLDRMYALADRAVDLEEGDLSAREGLDEEFTGYAHIVARLAGADEFDGPSLSLLTRAEAVVARRILGCLAAARHDFSQRLREQRRRINSAMDEALEMLAAILADVDEISHNTREGLTALVAHLRALGGELGDPGAPGAPPRWLN